MQSIKFIKNKLIITEPTDALVRGRYAMKTGLVDQRAARIVKSQAVLAIPQSQLACLSI